MNPYSIIIPSRNIQNLLACVRQLREMGEMGRVIVVWDTFGNSWDYENTSVPDGAMWIYGIAPFVFARNCNIGIRAAGEDDVVLLNDDALLKTHIGFALLREQIKRHPEFGAVCPSFNFGGCRHLNLVNRGRPHIAHEPIMLIFAACYIPRSTINLVGLLDERFCINAGGPGARGYGLEDDDYSLRIRKAGLKLGVYDGVLCDHTTLKSTFRTDPEHPHDVRAHENLFRQIHGHWPEGHGYAPGKS